MKKLIAVCLFAVFFCVFNAKADTIFPVALNATSGTLGTDVYGISGNNIVGLYTDASGADYGFLYNGTTYTTLNATGGTKGTYAYGIGISGNNIVGSYYDGSEHGFFYNGTTYTTINAPAGINGTDAYGISGNNIVGSYSDSSSLDHGFLYNLSTSATTTLDAPLATFGTYAHGISGDNIVGAYLNAFGVYHGFLYNGGIWTTIDVPGATNTDVYGISGKNIVGSYFDGSYHGFLYNGTTYTTFDASGATAGTIVTGIYGNKVVGTYTDGSGDHGFVQTFPATHWATAVSGNWSDSTKWTGILGVPNAVGVGAVINPSTATALTVTLDSPQTIGTLLLGNSGSVSAGYTIAGSGSNSLTFDNSGDNATITVIDGSHAINAPVILASNLAINGSGTLSFGSLSSITDSGKGLSLIVDCPDGMLTLGGSNTYSGGTLVTSGTLVITSMQALLPDSTLSVDTGGLVIFSSGLGVSAAPMAHYGTAIASLRHEATNGVPEPSTIILLISGLLIGGLLFRRRK